MWKVVPRGCSSCHTKPNHWNAERRETWCLVAAPAATPNQTVNTVGEKWKLVPRGCSSCHTKPIHWHVGEKRNVMPGSLVAAPAATPNQTIDTWQRCERWCLVAAPAAIPNQTIDTWDGESCDAPELRHETKSLWHSADRATCGRLLTSCCRLVHCSIRGCSDPVHFMSRIRILLLVV